ncbi:PREDICTED: dentin sialophosphoprotein-like [Cyphomyrmex costatus]|nr:PREDICTED: dentin sialophosphoprotein-like [Cyphomyrmex costatus]
MNIFGGNNRVKHHRHKQSTTENIMPVTGQSTLEEVVKEEILTNCASNNKKNQRYSSSFFANTTGRALSVEKEFHDVVGNNSKVKKSSSVHEGEDITLCWIETTTIKEDKTIRPPKRLVIREYTISFENSATIPERYLECKKFEGELTANDPDIGKTALFEIIDEDTMVSRIVNFTSVNHVGNIITWEHKKVKCGVGPVVSKNIVELNDGSKNPKKRVEIKVSPKMHQLTATTTEEECTESSTLTESMTEHTTALPCENGACEATMFSPSIVSKIDKFSTTEEIVTKLQSESESESDEDRLFTATKSLPEEAVSRRSTIFPKKTTIQEKIDCEEDPSDPACLMQKYDTSSEELFIKELTTTETAETSLISDKEVTSKEEIFQPSIEEKSEEITQSVSTSKEEEVVSEVIGETTPFAFAKDIFTKSSEAYASQSTDQASVDASSLETKITTSHSAEYVEEYSKPEEDKDSNVLTSEELEKVDYISSSSESIVTSSEVGIEPGVTTEKSSVEFIEFTKKPSKPDQIFDKLSESPISTKSVTGTIMIESSSMSEEVTSKETKERAVGEETTMIGLKTSEEREFISTIPTKVRSTTLSPVRSGEVSYSCENSEDCASSEGCDEFGNCEKRLPKFDTIRPPKLIKVPLSEESRITEHTTVTNVATTMLISQESDGRSTAKHITTDTRRSTTTSTPQHKLSLKVKILLEHINENKEKHNLVEVEKHLSLDENPEHHLNPDLLEQLKSLNDSVNMETINALLNCTSLGNLTKNSNFVDKEPNNVDSSDAELEFKNTDFEDLSSEQFISRSDDAKVDYSEYQEHVTSRRRKRRSFDNEMEDLNKFVQQKLYDSSDSVVDTFNNSQTQHNESTNTTYGLQLSTTTNYSQEETTTNNYTESERNITKQEDQSTMSSTIITISDVDLSNTSESRDANVTKEDVQLTTTYKPEEETNITMYIESETNITNGINESIVPSTRNNMSNETKMEVVRETIPGIQEDVVAGLQHMVSQLSQSNLTLINNVKEAVKTNLLGILADPSDSRVRLRRRRAATEKVGHWSNERIKEAPMGGNLRSFTEFTLYKVPS